MGQYLRQLHIQIPYCRASPQLLEGAGRADKWKRGTYSLAPYFAHLCTCRPTLHVQRINKEKAKEKHPLAIVKTIHSGFLIDTYRASFCFATRVSGLPYGRGSSAPKINLVRVFKTNGKVHVKIQQTPKNLAT